MQPKKSLGQHFLHSQKAIKDIVGAGHIQKIETVLEIGPGKGVLTEVLLLQGARVIALEKDRDLIPVLSERFANEIAQKSLILLEKDVLVWNPEEIQDPYKLVANIPYYITGAILEKFLSTSHQPSRMVLLIQKEVAERIIARDGKQSILSIAVQAYGAASIAAKVPAGAFTPPPKVDSAVLVVENISRNFFADCNETLFFAVLKSLFGKKRKQMGATLAEFVGDKSSALCILTGLGIDPRTRPEDLSLAMWKKITQAIEKSKNGVQ